MRQTNENEYVLGFVEGVKFAINILESAKIGCEQYLKRPETAITLLKPDAPLAVINEIIQAVEKYQTLDLVAIYEQRQSENNHSVGKNNSNGCGQEI